MRYFGWLTDSQRARFGRALRRFVADLLAMEAGQKTWFRPGLRAKPVRGAADLFEMSWAPNGSSHDILP